VPLEKEDVSAPASSSVQQLRGLLRADGYQQAAFRCGRQRNVRTAIAGPVARMIKLKSGMTEAISRQFHPGDGRKNGLCVYQAFDMDLYAYVSVPASYVTSRWWRHNAPIFISFLVFFGIFVVIAYRVTKHERSHSNELVEQARRDALTDCPIGVV